MEQPEQSHIERVQAYLEQRGYVVEPFALGIHISLQRASGEFPVFCFIPRATVTLAVVAEPPLKVSEDRRAEAAILLSRMNFGMLDGCFEMNPDSGQLRYRNTLNFAGVSLSESLIANLLDGCDLAMRSFLPVLQDFIKEGVTPEEALRLYVPSS